MSQKLDVQKAECPIKLDVRKAGCPVAECPKAECPGAECLSAGEAAHLVVNWSDPTKEMELAGSVLKAAQKGKNTLRD